MTVLAINQPSTRSPAPNQAPAPNAAPGAAVAAAAPAAEPRTVAELFAPWLLEHENPDAYLEIHDRMSAAVKPADILEEIWVRDVVDLVWEVFRLRQLKACLMDASAPEGLAKLLSSFLPFGTAHEIAAGWAGRDGERVRQVSSLLDQSGFTMEHVMAEALAERIEAIERIDRMTASAEERRGTMLREIDRHRASLASRLRLASDEVVQAEFEDVAPARAAPGGRPQ